ncbi:MAG: hypothetical protein RIR79_482 [Pseudomonadota bacterium]|jgi:hypothetical protein
MHISIKYFGFIALAFHLTACEVKIGTPSTSSTTAASRGDGFSAPRGRYAYSVDGKEVKDIETGLIWQTCQVGMTWNGNTCTGEAKKFTYDEAMALSGRNGRLPTIRELASLIKCSSGKFEKTVDVGDGGAPIKSVCAGSYTTPTIDTEAFPNTPASDVWSGSPFAGNTGGAWFVSFSYGFSGYNGRNDDVGVRLVRGGQ